MSYRTTAFALWGLLVGVPGFAAEFDAADPDDQSTEISKDEEDKPAPAKVAAPAKSKKDDFEEYGPWQVKIPAEYRGDTFKLRIGDEILDLNKDEITLKGSDFREKVDLIVGGGRLMSSDTIYVDPYIFDYVDSRDWRVSLFFGGASVAGEKFRGILQDNWLAESSLDFEWQPSQLGLMVSFAGLSSEQEHEPGVTSNFNSSQSRLSATYEWVPLRRSTNGFFRKLHLLTYAGILSAHDAIEISDDLVSLQDESNGTGGLVGNDFMFPFWRFWINIRLYASFHTIKFEKLDFEQKSVQHGVLIGGSYAF